MGGLVIFVFCIILIVIDFIPTYVYYQKTNKQRWGWFFLFNLIFGWTAIGWVVLLIIAIKMGGDYQDRAELLNAIKEIKNKESK